jgi:hypothetical protein
MVVMAPSGVMARAAVATNAQQQAKLPIRRAVDLGIRNGREDVLNMEIATPNAEANR